jgi:hypothetical protein
MRDTVRITIPEVKVDTVFHTDQLIDTVTIVKDNLKVKIYTVHDSVYVEGKCDTVYVEKILEKKVPIVHYESRPDWWPWLKWILICLFILAVLYIVFNRKKK